jgi:hypothetical protein
MFCTLARALAIGGGGSQNSAYHAAVLPRVFPALEQSFGAPFLECCASPINAYYERYLSLCLDTDYKFGSLGSFFACRPGKGHFFIHPPAVPGFVNRVLDHIFSWFPTPEHSERRSLTVLLLVSNPLALPQEEFDRLGSLVHVVVTRQELAAFNHAFLDGQQHRKENQRIFRKPHPYPSLLCFFQTQRAARKVPITGELLREVKFAFRFQHDREKTPGITIEAPPSSSATSQETSADRAYGNFTTPPAAKRIRFD